MSKEWFKLAYQRDLESEPDADSLARKWFPRAMLHKEFAGRAILEIARYRDYIKLKKIVRVVDEIDAYRRNNKLEPGQVNILDIGCGIGIYSAALARLGYQVYGIDMNEEVLDEARARFKELPNLRFITGDAETFLNECRTSFNVVLLLDVLEHMPSPGRVCREVQKKLVNNGMALIIVPSGFDIPELLVLAPERLYKKIRRRKEPEGAPHCQKFTLAAIKGIISQAGLEYNLISSIYTTWFPFIVLLMSGRRSLPAYLNMKIADRLPPFLTSSWLIKAFKKQED